MNKKIISLLISASLAFGASQALAGNITIRDGDNSPAFGGIYSDGGGFGINPNRGVGNEDQETEHGTIHSQAWDMEAFLVNGTTLTVIGGYDMKNGILGTSQGDIYTGDIFIKVGGSQPSYLPTSGGNVLNSPTYGTPGYTYAINLTGGGNTITGSTATVYDLTNSSLLASVINDDRNANPYRYFSGNSQVRSTAITYVSGKTDAQILTDYGQVLEGGSHNVLTVDLGFLVGTVPAGTAAYFSYTMGCGNDSLKGRYGDGFDRHTVPDSSASALLIVLGLGAISLFSLKRRKS